MRWNAAQTHANREAWLAARRIGSSDVACILGRSPYGGPHSVWARLMGRARERKTTAHMRQGLSWEPVIRAAYQVETGRQAHAFRPWTLFTGPEEWATSTPDGAVKHGSEWGLLELKQAHKRLDWPESGPLPRWEHGALPRPDWYLQCQHQCWVLDAPWCDLAVLLPSGHRLRVYRIYRDGDLLGNLIPMLREWYARHVLDGVPVPADTPDEALAVSAEMHGEGRYARRKATPREAAVAMQLQQARLFRDQYDAHAKELQAHLFHSAGRASALTYERGGHRMTISIVRAPSPHVRVSMSRMKK